MEKVQTMGSEYTNTYAHNCITKPFYYGSSFVRLWKLPKWAVVIWSRSEIEIRRGLWIPQNNNIQTDKQTYYPSALNQLRK